MTPKPSAKIVSSEICQIIHLSLLCVRFFKSQQVLIGPIYSESEQRVKIILSSASSLKHGVGWELCRELLHNEQCAPDFSRCFLVVDWTLQGHEQSVTKSKTTQNFLWWWIWLLEGHQQSVAKYKNIHGLKWGSTGVPRLSSTKIMLWKFHNGFSSASAHARSRDIRTSWSGCERNR